HGTNRNGPRAVVAFHGQVLPSRPGAHRVGHAAALIGWAPPAHGRPSTVATSRISTMVARPCSGTGEMQQLTQRWTRGRAGSGRGAGAAGDNLGTRGRGAGIPGPDSLAFPGLDVGPDPGRRATPRSRAGAAWRAAWDRSRSCAAAAVRSRPSGRAERR